MHQHFHLDVDRIRAQGLPIGIGKALTLGRRLSLEGHEQIAKGLSDVPALTEYTEVEIVGLNGAPSLFILTESLLLLPQLFLGYHVSGCPLLLGVTTAMAKHTLILRQTQAGKSTIVVVEELQDLIAH